MTQEQEINEELARWAGFYWFEAKAKLSSPESFATEVYQCKGWHYPDGSNCFELPDFVHSLDACLKWLVPKIDGYRITGRDNKPKAIAEAWRNLPNFISVIAEAETPALALCLAIKKLKEEK